MQVKHQKREKRRIVVLFFSTSISVFLLEWILSDVSDYHLWLLYLFYSTNVIVHCIIDYKITFVSRLPQNRLQIAVTLLLTSITFRWTVNRSLVSLSISSLTHLNNSLQPTISYLTSLDKYSIISIFILVILIIWHAIMGTIVFVTKNYPSVDTDNPYVWIDRYVFFILVGAFLLMHIVMVAWLFSVPLAYRRQMIRKDHQYLLQKENSKSSRQKTKSRVINGKTLSNASL